MADDVLIHPGQLTAAERREVARLRRSIRDRGWALVEGCVDLRGRHVPVRYTAGLTRHHGHPEFIVVGAPLPREHDLLAGLAEQVAGGIRLEPCWVEFGSRTAALVEVERPALLWLAHLVYGREGHPVSALQVVGADRRGRWPWADGEGDLLGEWPFA